MDVQFINYNDLDLGQQYAILCDYEQTEQILIRMENTVLTISVNFVCLVISSKNLKQLAPYNRSTYILLYALMNLKETVRTGCVVPVIYLVHFDNICYSLQHDLQLGLIVL